jgi:hypothetical protein
MKRTLLTLCLLTLIGVCLLPTASVSADEIPCFLCDPGIYEPDQGCSGFGCPGVPSVTTCWVWWANNCPNFFAPFDVSDEEIFLLSLEAQAAPQPLTPEEVPS